MRHVPNVLSAARLLAAPYVFVLLWTHQWDAALVWMVIIGATDGFDGYVARRFQATSKLGAMLDPIADKVLLSGAFLTLATNGTIPVWLAWLVLGRDAVILLFVMGVLLFTKLRREFPPSLAGKLSTIIQMGYVVWVVAGRAGYILAPDELSYIVLAVTGWSSVDYGIRGMKLRRT
jgi:cardiolipin synthase (CMP-forming)